MRRSMPWFLLFLCFAIGGPDPASGEEMCAGTRLIFYSLRHGEFDYCRERLSYRPGRVECLRILLPTCHVLQPDAAPPSFLSQSEWILHGQAERVVCPRGPSPPSCPAGFGERATNGF